MEKLVESHTACIHTCYNRCGTMKMYGIMSWELENLLGFFYKCPHTLVSVMNISGICGFHAKKLCVSLAWEAL